MRRTAVLTTLLPILLTTTACGVSALEKQGDRAMAAGDRESAAKYYAEAINLNGRMMDFEYERLRDKQARAKAASWTSSYEALAAERTKRSGVAYADAVIKLRRAARDASADAEITAKIDTELTSATESGALLKGAPKLDELFALARLAIDKRAPAALPGITDAIMKTIDQGLPEVRARGGLDALETMVDLKLELRMLKLPTTVDAALDRQLAKLGDVTIPPVTAATAAAMFDRALVTRDKAITAGAPAPAIAVATRVRDAALPHLTVAAEALVTRKHYVAAYDLLAARARLVEPGHPLLARLAAIRTEAVAWHTEQTSKQPAATRLLHYGIVRSFDAGTPAAVLFTPARESLATELRLGYGFAFTVTAEPACGDIRSAFPKPAATTVPVLPVNVDLRCKVSDRKWQENDSVIYEAEEEYQETKIVESESSVGGDDSCSALSVQSGTCRATHVITRTPVTTTHKREVKGRVSYQIERRDIDVSVSGFATVTAEDGTQHGAPIEFAREAKAKAYKYVLPPRRPGEAARGENVPFPAGHTPEEFVASARSRVGEVPGALRAKLDAHRGAQARAQGVAAVRAGDPTGAGEAYLRSVLLEGKVTGEAAAWLLETHGLTAEQASSVLSGSTTRAALTPATVTASATPYVPGPAADLTDNYKGAAASAETRSDKWLELNVRPGNEPFGVHFGLLAYNMGSTTDRTPTAFTAGMEMWGALIGRNLPWRYGFVLHDEIGGRAFIGYGDGLAWGAEGIARLYAGYRTHQFGIFAGASSGYLRASVGDTKASGAHAEPAVRMTFRLTKVRKVVLEGMGFVGSFGTTPRSDRVAISFPQGILAYRLSFEQLKLPTTAVVGDDEMDLGRTNVRVYGVEVGGSF